MEVWSIVNVFKSLGKAPSTEKASVGRRYEKIGLAYFRWRGFRKVRTNWELPPGEIDLLMVKNGSLFLIEIRGSQNPLYSPMRRLTQNKRKRLQVLANYVSRQSGRPIRILFLEFRGRLPLGGFPAWVIGSLPRIFGLAVRTWRIRA